MNELSELDELDTPGTLAKHCDSCSILIGSGHIERELFTMATYPGHLVFSVGGVKLAICGEEETVRMCSRCSQDQTHRRARYGTAFVNRANKGGIQRDRDA